MRHSLPQPARVLQAGRVARAELARRQAARQHVLDFARYTLPDYKAGAHHALLARTLEQVEAGRITRLMVFMPPRHGKSELTSRRFPAWYLGRHPRRQIIGASYGATLAQDFGRDVRNIVASSRYGALFSATKLAADSSARDVWHTAQGGGYTGMGVGGGLTGRGAHLAIIDDPVKDRQEAESPARRAAVLDWYRAVLRTRLMPGGAIVLVMTRWSMDDLAGRLLDDMHNKTGEAWHVLDLPALATAPDALGRIPGQALWPQAFDTAELARIRQAVGEREWAALYQQNPVPLSGNLFHTHMLGVQEALPAASGPAVRRWDLAATRQTGSNNPDWTVGVKMHHLPDGRFVVADITRLRGDPAQVEATLLATAARDGVGVDIVLPQDPGQAGVAQARYLTGRLAGYKVRCVRETGDKATRAAPFAAQVNAGNVLLLRAPWVHAFMEELAAFPVATHDDQVDAAAGAFAALAEAHPLPRFGPDFLARI